MKYHSEPTYACAKCGRKFHTPGDLKRHENINTHRGEKPGVCSFYEKLFATKEALQRHQATYSDERKF